LRNKCKGKSANAICFIHLLCIVYRKRIKKPISFLEGIKKKEDFFQKKLLTVISKRKYI